MVMHRSGLFDWELKRIELPTDFAEAPKASNPANYSKVGGMVGKGRD
jgi:hypothetical protein